MRCQETIKSAAASRHKLQERTRAKRKKVKIGVFAARRPARLAGMLDIAFAAWGLCSPIGSDCEALKGTKLCVYGVAVYTRHFGKSALIVAREIRKSHKTRKDAQPRAVEKRPINVTFWRGF